MSKRTNAHDRDAHRVGIRLHDLFSRLAASPPNTDHSDLYVEGDSLINEICAYSRLAGLSEGWIFLEGLDVVLRRFAVPPLCLEFQPLLEEFLGADAARELGRQKHDECGERDDTEER